MASTLISKTLFANRFLQSSLYISRKQQFITSLFNKRSSSQLAAPTYLSYKTCRLVASNMASSIIGSCVSFSSSSVLTNEPVVSVDWLHANLREPDMKVNRLMIAGLSGFCRREFSALKFQFPFKISSTLSLSPFLNPSSWKPSSLEPRYYGIQSLSRHPNPEISRFCQKGFSEITSDTVGRALHAFFLKRLTESKLFYSNTLINMYSKFGKIEAAWYLFNQMPKRNEASWNTMISAFVRVGLYLDAVELFLEMQDKGVESNGFVIGSTLTACSRSENMVYEGFQIHGLVLKNGLLYNVFVGSALLHFYCVYGFACNAKELFDEMPERNVVSWTSLMVGCSDSGNFREVINMYHRMREEGVSCNQNTFTTAIASCACLEDEILGHQVLGHVIKSGYLTNLSVANSLISMFGRFNSIHEACYIFDLMDEYDTISWNSLIAAYAYNSLCEESFECFQLMCHHHDEIDSSTISSLLSACSSTKYLNWGEGVHCLVVKKGLSTNVCICNNLLTMYSVAGRCNYAKQLFQGMTERDLISWNSMIAGYVHEGKCLDALQVFAKLLRTRKMIDHVTFASALAACSDLDHLPEGKVVHAFVIITGIQGNSIVSNALVTMYGKCGIMWEAKKVFQLMPELDLVTWNALIGGYAENEETDEAVKSFMLMRERGNPANYITIINVLGACVDPCNLLKHGMPLHAHIILSGFEADEYVKNSLITMYAKCGDLNSSGSIFIGLIDKTAVTWNAMVAANARHGRGEEAIKLFMGMRRAGVDLDQFSFSAALAASADLALMEEGQQLHLLAIKLGFESYLYVTNAIMDMYGKCGEINDVLEVLPGQSMRSILVWNVLISALSRHGLFQKAIEAFHEMLKHGSKPNHVTFVSLLSACSHGGLVDEGLAYFASMTTEFRVPAGIEHYACVIDLLGRAGRLSEAEAFIKEMPIPPNDFVWRSLLAACRTHGNLELGKKAAERLLESHPMDGSAYVLYSNVCASTRRWDDVHNVRVEMESNKVKKEPACSWVKLKHGVGSFGIGDQSHTQAPQIYVKLGELKRKIVEAGYVPDTSFALHDTDEEQKEHNLWSHSERLALAYGLINTPEGSRLRIFKNLRVCGDCHSVFKFVSTITRREIVLRDPYRFHHFSSGKCSCGDYW